MLILETRDRQKPGSPPIHPRSAWRLSAVAGFSTAMALADAALLAWWRGSAMWLAAAGAALAGLILAFTWDFRRRSRT